MKLKLVINRTRQVLNRCVPSDGIRSHQLRLKRDWARESDRQVAEPAQLELGRRFDNHQFDNHRATTTELVDFKGRNANRLYQEFFSLAEFLPLLDRPPQGRSDHVKTRKQDQTRLEADAASELVQALPGRRDRL